MNVQHTSLQQAGSEESTSLYGFWLIVARTVWIIMVLLALGLFLASVPTYFAYLHILGPTPLEDAGMQLSLHDLQDLQSFGLSISFYAWYNITLNIIFVLSYSLVGIVLFLRKSENRVALFASFTLIMFSIDQNIIMLQTLPPVWKVSIMGINFLGSLSISLFFLLFPSGRFAPRWTRWLGAAQVMYWITNIFLLQSQALVIQLLNFAVFLILEGSLVVVQIYRYRCLSRPVEQQQTKWVVFGTSLGLGGYLIGSLVVFTLGRVILHVNMALFITGYTLLDGLLLLFPISIGVAILRSRLWDIDILINRTLVYSLLTVVLALIYFGLVISFQFLLDKITGQASQSPFVLVVSTLAIAALFQPLRHRIQSIIDRRFYRSKYNAKRTVANFSATLRGEVDLVQLSEQLVEVVEETMQPKHVSLWLNKPHQSRPGNYKQEDLPFSQTS